MTRPAATNRAAALATLLIALAGVVAVAWLAAPRADAVPASKAISLWNKQRTLHGIPAGIGHAPALSDGCRKHNEYMAQNGITHFEEEGRPGYTPEGKAAGESSVLGQGSPPWNSLQSNPWENAPIHLIQMLDPRLKVTGYDESQNFECATTLSFYRGYAQRPAPPRSRLFTYPGPGTRHYRGQEAREAPFTPGQLVGIPQGAPTGPYLHVIVFADAGAPWDARADITRAWLRSPSGRKLEVKVIDQGNEQLAPYIPPGGFVIPRKPLRAGKRYTAHVRVSFDGQTLKRTWRFRATKRFVG